MRAVHGRVYDVTPLIAQHPGELVEPMVKAAGSDITHWFDEYGDPRRHQDPLTNINSPYVPQGMFLHVKPMDPRTDIAMEKGEVPWWADTRYQVGWVSRNLIRLRVKNLLAGQEHMIEVPMEETLQQVSPYPVPPAPHRDQSPAPPLPARASLGAGPQTPRPPPPPRTRRSGSGTRS